jgi:hypothetical protein
MRNVIVLLLLVAIGWFGYTKYQARVRSTQAAELEATSSQADVRKQAMPAPNFKCDGRVYCSQMTSCAEATFFLRNCPGVKMDGDGNGIPCERQWCSK